MPITITTDPPKYSVLHLDSIPKYWFTNVDFSKHKETYVTIGGQKNKNGAFGRILGPDTTEDIAICCLGGLSSDEDANFQIKQHIESRNRKFGEDAFKMILTIGVTDTTPAYPIKYSRIGVPLKGEIKPDSDIENKTYITIGLEPNPTGVFAVTFPTKPDTMCFETEVIRKVLIAANEGKEYKKQVGLLTERIALKDQIISQMNERDSLVKAGYENQMSILQQELALRKDQMEGYERLLKKERRKRRAVAAAGLTATGVLTYLLITK